MFREDNSGTVITVVNSCVYSCCQTHCHCCYLMQHAALSWGLQLLLVAKCSSDHLYQHAVVTAVEKLNSSELFYSSLYCRQAVSQSSFSVYVFQNFHLFSIFPYYSFLFCDMFRNCCSHIHLGLLLGIFLSVLCSVLSLDPHSFIHSFMYHFHSSFFSDF